MHSSDNWQLISSVMITFTLAVKYCLQHSILQSSTGYSTVPYSTVQSSTGYSTVPHGTVQSRTGYSTVQFSTVQSNTGYSTVQSRTGYSYMTSKLSTVCNCYQKRSNNCVADDFILSIVWWLIDNAWKLITNLHP
jgi:hypothetical protein